jgi:hypothetical protein
MRIYPIVISLIFLVLLPGASAYCALSDQDAQTDAKVSVSAIFRADCVPPNGTSIMFANTITFSNIDPNKSFALPDGRAVGDGKSDVGISCKSSGTAQWFLKIGITAGNMPDNKLKYYLSQPYIWDNEHGVSIQTNGTIIPDPPGWTPIPRNGTTTVYSSGTNDTSNIPLGTLLTLSFQVDTMGLTAGTYSATVTYTMSTTP